MYFSFPRLGLALALVAASSACGSAGAGGGGGGWTWSTNTGTSTAGASVRFEDSGTLTLVAGDKASLVVVVEPPISGAVTFSLAGDASGAWLDADQVDLDASGRAQTVLHAPPAAATFHVRASLLDASGAGADRLVVVSADGFGSVQVSADYAGKRPISAWSAAVVPGMACADLQATLPEVPSTALTADAPDGDTPVVTGVPVGPTFAVVMRAGHYAYGCVNAGPVTPDGVLDASVAVLDRPLDLSAASLDATFRFDADLPLLAPLLTDAASSLGAAFLAGGTPAKDASVLLNAMAAQLSPAQAAGFTLQRNGAGWDALTATHLAALPLGLREQLTLWSAAGMAQQDPSFELTLLPGGAPTEAAVGLVRFGDVLGADAGGTSGATLTWSALTGDLVALNGSLPWSPGGFARAAAFGPGEIAYPGSATLGAALASYADCDGLGQTLGGFGAYDAAFVGQLCASAVEARLDAACAGIVPGVIDINATADASVGDAAEPIALQGTWIGTIGSAGAAAKVGGDLQAATH
jgi:hypothetical protein